MSGLLLTLTIISGKNLASKDSNGFSDPYCVFRLSTGQGSKKTKVIKKSLNPVWNQTFEMGSVKADSVLKLTCWDHDTFSSDDFLGQFSVKLEMFLTGVEVEFTSWFPLEERHPEKPEGVTGGLRVTFRIHFPEKKEEMSREIDVQPSGSLVNPSSLPSPYACFGVNLRDLMERQKQTHPELKIPVCCQIMIQEIRERGIKEMGIFRMAGNYSHTLNYKNNFNLGLKLDFSLESDIHTVAALLKMFLRELPEPILTFSSFDELIKGVPLDCLKTDGWLESLKKKVCQLPSPNFHLLREVIQLCVSIAENSEFNKMSSDNLMICISPNILWDEAKTSFVNNTAHIGLLTLNLIEQFDYIFKIDPKFIRQNTVGQKEQIAMEGRRLFLTYDFNGDGHMDKVEFTFFYSDMMASMNLPLPTEADIDDTIAILDKDKNNEISYEEFAEWWTEINTDVVQPIGVERGKAKTRHASSAPTISRRGNRPMMMVGGQRPRGRGRPPQGAVLSPPLLSGSQPEIHYNPDPSILKGSSVEPRVNLVVPSSSSSSSPPPLSLPSPSSPPLPPSLAAAPSSLSSMERKRDEAAPFKPNKPLKAASTTVGRRDTCFVQPVRGGMGSRPAGPPGIQRTQSNPEATFASSSVTRGRGAPRGAPSSVSSNK